jgi:flagellar basal body-associated protein FliL
VESIGRNTGGEYDNLTAAILEMNNNSILKEKMNKTAKIIIAILAILLVGSIALNISYLIGNSKKDTMAKNKTEIVPKTSANGIAKEKTAIKEDSIPNKQN